MIETVPARVVAEPVLGDGLGDVVVLKDGVHLLAVDRAGARLLLLRTQGDSVDVAASLGVAADPASVIVSPDGGWCVVASTWSRRLTFVDLRLRPSAHARDLELAARRTLDLPLSPRNMTLARDASKLIVADAFGGKLAVVDPRGGVLESVRTLPAHNIRGLGVTPDGRELAVAHQVLRRVARTDFEDVFWGRLVTSHVRSLNLDAVLSPGSDTELLRDSVLIDLGAPYEGAADPSALACDRPGVVAVALGGVGEVALGAGPSRPFRRASTGGRPSALALAPDGKTLYVADSAGDSVAVVSVESGRGLRTISLGPRPAPSLVERGERLFHDARLSLDGWMSCHSCHTDGHSNGQLGDTLGDGSFGAPKRVPSLLGVGTTGPWAWTGSMARLEDQVRKSVERTMRGKPLSDDQVEALVAYLHSLTPPRPLILMGDGEAVARGREVFRTQECAGCHAPPTYTSKGRHDVGLVDEAGNRRFNPPSLRGVSRREPLLHDGRAARLENVFLEHDHPGGADMTPQQVADLVAFLKSL